MRFSKEYEEFLKEEFEERKLSLYEKLCNISEKILPFVPKGLEKKYNELIEFCHLNITPKGAFSLSILAPTIFSILLIGLAILLNFFSSAYLTLVLIFSGVIFYYLYNYLQWKTIYFKVSASSEMVLAIVYMSMSMKIVPNLENAVIFASSNLKGPLARDLKKVIWDVYMGRYTSVSDSLEEFSSKWKVENKEFVEALSMIKSAYYESPVKRDKILNESIEVVLNGTKERMKRYAMELRTPLTVLNALGILLPIIGLTFFPIVSIFLPDVIRPSFLAIGYCVLLPIVIYFFMVTYLQQRPPTLHQPEVERHPKLRKEKKILKLLISLIPSAIIIPFSYIQLTSIWSGFSFMQIIYSLLIIISISSSIFIYLFLTTYPKIPLRNEIVHVESELGVVLFQTGLQLSRGVSLENTLERIKPRIRNLKIFKFFDDISRNMRNFGLTFSQAVFDERIGVINYYPSRLIDVVMKAIAQMSRSGMQILSQAMLSISNYLKNMSEVEESLKEALSEVVSTMQIQSLLLAPLTAGIIVGLTAMITQIMVSFAASMEKIQESLASAGVPGMIGRGILTSIISVNSIIPIHLFQLVVGIYMIETVILISFFSSSITHGEESLLRKYEIGKTLLISTLIYASLVILLFQLLTSILPLMGLME